MKGLTHFVLGVTSASFVPGAIEAALTSNPWYFVLGGASGLLPDTLDFRFARFLCRQDMEVVPDPLNPDPAMIARAFATAVGRAVSSTRPFRIKLHTVPVGPSRWHAYSLELDTVAQRVVVRFEPRPGAQADGAAVASASAPLPRPVAPEYLSIIEVGIFDGPTLELAPMKDGRILVRFLPWHRMWSHSLLLPSLYAVLALALRDVAFAAVTIAGHLSHILADQAGFMGSAVWFPFSRRRVLGLRWRHSTDAFLNLTMVWLAVLILLWNLSRFRAGESFAWPLSRLLLYGGAIPLAIIRGVDAFIGAWDQRHQNALKQGAASRKR